VGEAKTCGNYAASLLPAQKAKEKGYDQVLWLDAHEFKYIQEVGTMNIFFVLKDKVITPATEGAILKGITRKTILDILKKEDYVVEERKISINEIKEYYKNGDLVEVFGSGTAAVIANVNKIADGDFIMEFDKSHWNLSQRLKKYINGLRNGTIHDPYGWTVPLSEEVLS
jgi:branched-chain amino acid aminotransferase